MNDKELKNNVNKALENFIKELATNPEKVFDNNDLQIKYNNLLKEKIKLQSNWNSLRKWLEEQQKEVFHIGDKIGIVDSVSIDVLLDKMNELEGGEDNG